MLLYDRKKNESYNVESFIASPKKKILTWNYATFSQAPLAGPMPQHYCPHHHYDEWLQ